MVIINPEQERILADLARLKAAYDREIHKLEERLADLKSEHKEPLREGVRRAKDAGIPDRQIHIKGLGMAQYGQMVNFLKTPAAKRSQSEEFERDLYGQYALDTPVAVATLDGLGWEFRGIDASGKMFEAISPTNERYGINLFPMGKTIVMKPNKDKPGEFADWTPELIKAAKQHNSRWITTEEFSALSDNDDEED